MSAATTYRAFGWTDAEIETLTGPPAPPRVDQRLLMHRAFVVRHVRASDEALVAGGVILLSHGTHRLWSDALLAAEQAVREIDGTADATWSRGRVTGRADIGGIGGTGRQAQRAAA